MLNTLERIIERNWKLDDRDYVKSETFGHYINLFLKARYKTNDLNALKERILDIDNYLLSEIKKSSLILLSFESTEIWVDKEKNKAWYSFYGNLAKQKCYKSKAKLEVLNYNSLKKIIEKIILLLNKVGKKKKIILTVSPHLLWSTYLNKDIQLADSYSKSNFTSVFNDLETQNVKFFPAIEILNSVDESIKYQKDFVHVTNFVCNKYLARYFEKIYFK